MSTKKKEKRGRNHNDQLSAELRIATHIAKIERAKRTILENDSSPEMREYLLALDKCWPDKPTTIVDLNEAHRLGERIFDKFETRLRAENAERNKKDALKSPAQTVQR